MVRKRLAENARIEMEMTKTAEINAARQGGISGETIAVTTITAEITVEITAERRSQQDRGPQPRRNFVT